MRKIIFGFILVLSFSLKAQEKNSNGTTDLGSQNQVSSTVVYNVDTAVGDDNKIYVTGTDSMAGPKGNTGLLDFYKQFASVFRMPRVGNGVNQIRVMLSFVVEKDGSFANIKVLRDPGYGAGDEAIRVLKSMPYWNPAMLEGKPVRSQFTMPITIKIQ